jgi:hypothetical protein
VRISNERPLNTGCSPSCHFLKYLALFFLRYLANAVLELGSGSNNRKPDREWIQNRRAASAALFAIS